MTSFRLRPRFKHESLSSPETIVQQVAEALQKADAPCAGTTLPGFVVLNILPNQQHFWSPQLSLSIEKDEESGRTHIRGLYGPNPTIWAIIAFGYGALAVLFFFISIIGFSALTLGNEAPILWVLPLLVGLAVALYFVAQVGQKLGVEQTFMLHQFYEEVIGKKVHID